MSGGTNTDRYDGGRLNGGRFSGGGSDDGRTNGGGRNGGRQDENRQQGQHQCGFCKGSHLPNRCRTVTDINARYEIVSRERLCFICLKPSHRPQDCRLQFYNCVICQRRHNIAICDQSRGDRRDVYSGVTCVDPLGEVDNNGIEVPQSIEDLQVPNPSPIQADVLPVPHGLLVLEISKVTGDFRAP